MFENDTAARCSGQGCNGRPRVKRRISSRRSVVCSGGCQDKKRVLVENDLSSRHSKAENGGTLMEQAQIHSGALVQLGKMTCGGIGVAVSLPAAAAVKLRP